jgi:hypothetical protein
MSLRQRNDFPCVNSPRMARRGAAPVTWIRHRRLARSRAAVTRSCSGLGDASERHRRALRSRCTRGRPPPARVNLFCLRTLRLYLPFDDPRPSVCDTVTDSLRRLPTLDECFLVSRLRSCSSRQHCPSTQQVTVSPSCDSSVPPFNARLSQRHLSRQHSDASPPSSSPQIS